MYTDFEGHHSGGSSFDMYMMFGFCYKMWVIPTCTSSALKKKKTFQYMVSYPKLGSDPPIGSDRETRCDKHSFEELNCSTQTLNSGHSVHAKQREEYK